jgi:hypothetical protein
MVRGSGFIEKMKRISEDHPIRIRRSEKEESDIKKRMIWIFTMDRRRMHPLVSHTDVISRDFTAENA